MYRLVALDQQTGQVVWFSTTEESLEGWAEVIRIIDDPSLVFITLPSFFDGHRVLAKSLVAVLDEVVSEIVASKSNWG